MSALDVYVCECNTELSVYTSKYTVRTTNSEFHRIRVLFNIIILCRFCYGSFCSLFVSAPVILLLVLIINMISQTLSM